MFNLDQCTKSCIGCIKGYKKKHDLKRGQKFNVQCEGIVDFDNPQLELFQGLSKEESETAKTILDPVTWAKNTIDWHCLDPDGEIWKRKNPKEYFKWISENPGKSILGHSRYHRPYQAEMLTCTSKRKIFRCGRQCLTSDTKILLSNGETKTIDTVVKGDTIVSFVDNKPVLSTVTDHWNTGKKVVYKIKTKFGHSIKCTSDHKFFIANKKLDNYHGDSIDNVPHEWLSIDTGISKGSKIAVPLKTVHPEAKGNIPLARLLGYFIADGSCSVNQSAKFTNNNMDYLLEFEDLAKHFGSKVKWYQKSNGYDLIISNGRSKNNPLRSLLKDLNLTNIKGPEKLIPDCIFSSNEETTREFIKTFWAADGYVSTFKRTGRTTYRTEIGNLQENLKLVEQIQEILWRFGVHGYIKKEGNAYRYVISNKTSVKNFLNNIGLIPGKEEACKKAIENLPNVSDLFSNISDDLLWDYVSSIEELGVEDTWDIEVKGPSNFIANGILTHNCGKTESLIISMLYNLFTKPNMSEEDGFEIIVIAPFQAQIDLIFNRLLQLIKQNPATNNSLRRHVKAPIYTLELHNNSKVKGFTAGTKSGGNAEAVRGQHGNMLVFDEADYLAPADVEAALNIITNFPDASVWMSSTPSGKRERFYDTCHSELWKEFHYPSQVNPIWNEQQESMFREQMSEIAFKHEILAEFSEQEEGVFQNVYVQAAKQDYEYGQLEHKNGWVYTMGVDWNDVKNGTTIVVTGYNPTTSTFFVVDRATVSREGWNQLAACEKVAEFNRAWRPHAIYLDKGHGGTQYEVLRKYGYDSAIDPTKGPSHPDAKLRTILKQYDFGSKVEVRDLFTKQPVNKPAKPFLIENTVRRFEQSDIVFPASDKDLERQLLGYVVDRITPTGNPVYKANDETVGDHILDALMLACVAFTLEQTPFGKPLHSSRIAFSGYFGDNATPEAGPGDIIIKPDAEKKSIVREKQRPSMSRTETIEETSLISTGKELPASNTTSGNQLRLWQYPTGTDPGSKPKARSLSEAENAARRRLGVRSRGTCRPKRKNV